MSGKQIKILRFKGDKISLELTITPNLIVDLGYDDNNIHGTSNFAKIMFVYPPRTKICLLQQIWLEKKHFQRVI